MDDSVIRALARWPDVPGVFGYLALDMRGQWLVQGRRLEHQKTVDFINRNYEQDEHGRWFFQNGPQRAYVNLYYTPWIYRLRNDATHTHTGLPATTVTSAWLDDQGQLLLQAEHGIGLLHDQDLSEAIDHIVDIDGNQLAEQQMADALDQLHTRNDIRLAVLLAGKPVPLLPIHRDAVAARFNFDPHPAPRPEEAGRTQIASD